MAITLGCTKCGTSITRNPAALRRSRHLFCSNSCRARYHSDEAAADRLRQREDAGAYPDHTSKAKGNIGLANAIAYFARKQYFIFLPIGDNGGAIDLVVSKDGSQVQRVQCKYTTVLHKSTRNVYVLTRLNTYYGKESFDLLYVVTPKGDYLIDWIAYCAAHSAIPRNLKLWSSFHSYRV